MWCLLVPICFLCTLMGAALVSCRAGSSDLSTSTTRSLVAKVSVTDLAQRHGLVAVTEMDPSIQVDLRYSRADNVTGHVLYPSSLPCLVKLRTAQKLKKAQAYLKPYGYGLKVWDAWRPPEAHLRIWKAASTGLYVSNPKVGWSKHCYGRAIDATLVDQQGREMEMPSRFDDFTQRAHFIYRGPNTLIRERLRLLQRAMKSAGFTFIDTEWWHFNDAKDGEKITGDPVWGHELGFKF